jgi:hypothetical protein
MNLFYSSLLLGALIAFFEESLLADPPQMIQGVPIVHLAENANSSDKAKYFKILEQNRDSLIDKDAVCSELRTKIAVEINKGQDADNEFLQLAAKCLGSLSDKQAVPLFMDYLTVDVGAPFADTTLSGLLQHYPLAGGILEMGPSVLPQLLDATKTHQNNPQFQFIACRIIGFMDINGTQELVNEFKDKSTAPERKKLIARCLINSYGKAKLQKYIDDSKFTANPLSDDTIADLKKNLN